MTLKKLTKEALEKLVDELIKTEKVLGVQTKGDRFDFARPKKYFQPPVETLMTFKVGGRYKSEYDCEHFTLIGVHPYDMIAINQMDELFSQDNYDTHYMCRRKNTTIIACDVVTPSENVFASSMGTAIVKKGFDILLTNVGDGYVAEAGTEKGRQLLAKAPDADNYDIERKVLAQAENVKNLNKHKLKCDTHYLPKLLDKAYDHPIWEERAKTCFSCGSCNQVCPTCYCFNVCDDVSWDLKNGKRQRSWDGCLLDGFTKVAPDHEFRAKRADRFRHRLYRKAKYVPAKIGGQIACVGCGRCIGACLPDIANPVSVYNELIDDLGIS
jgi:sulfhydrogenase subunit beta (sulfur reductase)